MTAGALISIIAAAAVVLLGFGLVVGLRRLRERTRSQVQASVPDGSVALLDPSANCFGVQSRGMAQVRGNGCLCLTDDRLIFQMWVPKRRLEIPRATIRGVDMATSHLGKSKGVRLLRVRFHPPGGDEDCVAFAVRDLSAWQSALTSR